MTFIDYKKAYDKVPHSWILSCMTMCGISPTIINLFDTSFQQSYVNLMFGNDFVPLNKFDDVLGWQSKDHINNLIRQITENENFVKDTMDLYYE